MVMWLGVQSTCLQLFTCQCSWCAGQPLLQHALEIESQQPGGLQRDLQAVVHALPPSRQSSMLPVSELPHATSGGLHRVVGGV